MREKANNEKPGAGPGKWATLSLESSELLRLE